jgi:Protein of unknown function with PCYCGC motif
MKKYKTLLIIILVLGIGVTGVVAMRLNHESQSPTKVAVSNDVSPAPVSTKPKIPAYQSAEQAKQLGPTLEPSQFFGKAREAYQVAKRIPQTLAQLPCYCHCDQSFGHKSLHTCFEDDHASHCAVCVDEALLAYQLQKDEKLTPEQVRDRIIEKYSSEHGHSH